MKKIIKYIILSSIFGFFISLLTGLFENPFNTLIIGAKYYGFPFVWKISYIIINEYTEYFYLNLILNFLFYLTIIFILLTIFQYILLTRLHWYNISFIILIMILVFPLGIFMDFIHELGHVIVGIFQGGNLVYMQIMYLELYPHFALQQEFVLGYVIVAGITTEFGRGLFLLGGSLITNIVAWSIILLLNKKNFTYNKKVTLKVLGLFGILDLPFYVFFPQIGFSHWIFLGGNKPEPLIGARLIGITDSVFYFFVVITTLGLLFFYFTPYWKKIIHIIKFKIISIYSI